MTSWPAVSVENAALRDLVSGLEASCAELVQERDELRADRDALAFAIEHFRDSSPLDPHARLRLFSVLTEVSSRPSHSREVGEQVSPTGAVPDRTPASAGAASSISDEGAA